MKKQPPSPRPETEVFEEFWSEHGPQLLPNIVSGTPTPRDAAVAACFMSWLGTADGKWMRFWCEIKVDRTLKAKIRRQLQSMDMKERIQLLREACQEVVS